MKKFVQKLALEATIPVLCGLIVLNAYLAARNLKLMQKNTGQRFAAEQVQTQISKMAFDLQQMETSQRGYLLTADPAYLKSYGVANESVAAGTAALRSKLTSRDRPLEAQLESVMQAKIAEMNDTIRLRGQGYRHRAFVIVGSNRGKQLMDEARASLDALSAAQARDVARYEQELHASAAKAFRQSVFANVVLLIVAAVTFLAFHRRMARLELAYTQHDQQLRTAKLQLEKFTTAVFRDFRVAIQETANNASALANAYGGFLPRQAHEKLERIVDGAGHMISMVDDLSAGQSPRATTEDAGIGAVRRLSA